MTRRFVGTCLIVAALAVDVLACYQLAAATGARNDFFPRWLGTQLWLTEGANLYGNAVDESIRSAIGTVPLGAEGEPFVFGFVYPAYVALLLAPLAVLPYSLAATLWLLGVQASILGGAYCCWRAIEREQHLPAVNALPALVGATVFPGAVFTLLFLQFSALVFLGVAASWWLAAAGHRRWAGAVLALAGIKPTLALLPVLGLVIGVGRSRAVVAGVALAILASLLAASLFLLPGWPAGFLRSTTAYAAVAHPKSAASLIRAVLGLGDATALVLALSLLVAALIAAGWRAAPRSGASSLQAGVLAGAWLAPPLYEWNNVMLLIVLLPAVRLGWARGRRTAVACWCAFASLSTVTYALYLMRPSEARLVWPVLALAIYLAPLVSRALGRCGATALPPAVSSPATRM